MDQFSRSELLLGEAGITKLHKSSVIVFGIGGVGSYAAEALARAGVGRIGLVDDDVVCATNINRQLIASHSAVGKPKVALMAERIHDIYPECEVDEYPYFYDAGLSEDLLDIASYDYVLDAIDTVTSKLSLIEKAISCGVAVISCMGAGNKLDALRFKIDDISRTSYCPLARVMRKELRSRGIERGVKVVYSEETPLEPQMSEHTNCKFACICPPDSVRNCTERRQVPGSVPWVPSTAGLIMAGEVIKDLLGL